MDYTHQTTSALQITRAQLFAGLRNPRVANRAQVLRWVDEIEGELLARAEKEMPTMSKIDVRTAQRGQAAERITNPATEELLGWVMSSRVGWVAFDAKDRLLGEYRGVDAHNRASNRVWQAWEAKAGKVAA